MATRGSIDPSQVGNASRRFLAGAPEADWAKTFRYGTNCHGQELTPHLSHDSPLHRPIKVIRHRSAG
jgi:hypothetical protein